MTDIIEKINDVVADYVEAMGRAPRRIVASSDVLPLLMEASETRFGMMDRRGRAQVSGVPVVFVAEAPPGMVYCDSLDAE